MTPCISRRVNKVAREGCSGAGRPIRLGWHGAGHGAGSVACSVGVQETSRSSVSMCKPVRYAYGRTARNRRKQWDWACSQGAWRAPLPSVSHMQSYEQGPFDSRL